MEYNTIMETGIIRKVIIAIVAVVAIVAMSYLAGWKHGSELATIEYLERVDTLVIRDTITQYRPIVEERRVVERIPYPVVDTIRLQDTIYVYLEKEQLMWQDSLSRVYISGIMPQVDSVKHFIEEKMVVMHVPVKERSRWGLGISAGYGISVANGGLHSAPYIGIGISYNIMSW